MRVKKVAESRCPEWRGNGGEEDQICDGGLY